MADEELHPIELDDGNVAPEVRQVLEDQAAAADQQDNEQDVQQENQQDGQRGQPTAAQVFNRIVEFERVLYEAWTEFKNEILEELGDMQATVKRMDSLVRRQDEFESGDSVVLIDERKCGKVHHVTDKMLDIILDETKSKVRKKKFMVMRMIDRHTGNY